MKKQTKGSLHGFERFNLDPRLRRGIIEAGQDTDAPNFGRGTKKS